MAMLAIFFCCLLKTLWVKRRTTVDKRLRTNQYIRAAQVRLIDEDGSQLGIKTINEALALARERGKDLVEIAPNATPPVCKIVDFTKFKYEEEKREKEARKKQKIVHLKEVRLSPRIGEHDLLIKIDHARKFLTGLDKVQFTVMFRGRESSHKDLGIALAAKVKAALTDIADIERNNSMLGNRLIFVLTPKKT